MASVLVSDVLRAFLLRKDDWRGLTNQQGLRKIEHHLQLPAGTLHRFRHFVYILHSALNGAIKALNRHAYSPPIKSLARWFDILNEHPLHLGDIPVDLIFAGRPFPHKHLQFEDALQLGWLNTQWHVCKSGQDTIGSILDHRHTDQGSGLQYLVKWKGSDSSKYTWRDADEALPWADHVEQYWRVVCCERDYQAGFEQRGQQVPEHAVYGDCIDRWHRTLNKPGQCSCCASRLVRL